MSSATDVVEICRDLIRFDTSNFADGSGPGERACAEYVAGRLDRAGLEPRIIEGAPRRTNVVARVPGLDQSRPPLLVHGHTDVVPPGAQDWQVDPFGGEERDGYLWGRGAVDMKDMLAMLLAVLEERTIQQRPPARDLVVAFFADEEAGGTHGARLLADRERDLFADCDAAVSEVGGFSVTLDDARRVYFIETARRGVAWVRATARGRPGHGSLTNATNAITRLCAAVGRLGAYEWPVQMSETSTELLARLSALLGTTIDPARPDFSGTPLEPVSALITSSLRHTVNPTITRAGDAFNVVPEQAEAFLDCRFVPGFEEEFLAAVERLLQPHVHCELVELCSGEEAPFATDVVGAMEAALLAVDPGAITVPYCAATSSDAAAFHGTGIRSYGFTPLRLPQGFDFAAMYHGTDERVPIESLRFGTQVLDRFLDLC